MQSLLVHFTVYVRQSCVMMIGIILITLLSRF